MEMSPLPRPHFHHRNQGLLLKVQYINLCTCITQSLSGIQNPRARPELLNQNLDLNQLPKVSRIHICSGFITVSMWVHWSCIYPPGQKIRAGQKRNLHEIDKVEVERCPLLPQGPPSCSESHMHGPGSSFSSLPPPPHQLFVQTASPANQRNAHPLPDKEQQPCLELTSSASPAQF